MLLCIQRRSCDSSTTAGNAAWRGMTHASPRRRAPPQSARRPPPTSSTQSPGSGLPGPVPEPSWSSWFAIRLIAPTRTIGIGETARASGEALPAPSTMSFRLPRRSSWSGIPKTPAATSIWPGAQVLVVVMEDLAAEPAGTFRAVCRHLGIDSELVPEAVGGVWNGYAHVHHRGLLDMLLRIRAHRVLPDRVARAVFRRTYQTDVRPPPIGPALRARLVDHFSTDNAALADWLDRDLTIWNS